MNPVITAVQNVEHFKSILENNPGLVIMKFGASWCQPCITSRPLVHNWFMKMPRSIQVVDIDVDTSSAIYSFMKTKKMVSGIPTILCYIKGNTSYIPDEIQVGSSPEKINAFFRLCLEMV